MIYRNEHTVQTSWKILYNRFEGLERKTVEFLNRELSKYLVRADGVNTVYVLPCEKEGSVEYENAFVVGLYSESPIIREYIKTEEVPAKGFCVKVVNKKEDPANRLVLITAYEPVNLYYAAAEYFDSYPSFAAPVHGGLRYPEGIYESVTDEYFVEKPLYRMKEWTCSDSPKTDERGVFCWGQTINDYRKYFTDLARLRINRVVIWNAYMPLNAKEIAEFAASFGIKVVWGFAWGWNTNMARVTTIDESYIKSLEKEVIDRYEREYLPLGVDDIYFQSFTELSCDSIGGREIAQVVTDFVNATARRLWQKYPNLNIRFGLHATSVKNHLEKIALVDERMEIIWEDCGEFPFSYCPEVESEDSFEKTCDAVKKMTALRPRGKNGFMLKGFATSDWERFENQRGPFILGENDKRVTECDRRNRCGNWKIFCGEWIKYGSYAKRMIDFINAETDCGCGLYMVGIFDGGIYFPEAVCARLLWNADCDYDELMLKIAQIDEVINF